MIYCKGGLLVAVPICPASWVTQSLSSACLLLPGRPGVSHTWPLGVSGLLNGARLAGAPSARPVANPAMIASAAAGACCWLAGGGGGGVAPMLVVVLVVGYWDSGRWCWM